MKNVRFLLLGLILFAPATSLAKKGTEQVLPVEVTIAGFEPAQLKAKAGQDIRLEVTRTTDSTCATEILFPKLKIKKDLPLDKKVSVPLGRLAKGKYVFGCGMALMLKGELTVE